MEITEKSPTEAIPASIDIVSAIANAEETKKKTRKGKLIEPRIDEIVVEGRFRTHVGDLAGLARSMKEVGLLEPPIVDTQMKLVCGYRRLLAAKELGWTRVPVIILDIEDPLLATVAEDKERKPLLASEKYAVTEALRQRAQDPVWRRRAVGGAFHAAEKKGRLDEAIAKHVGLSRESLRKIRMLHERAVEDEERYGDLARMLDEDGRVDRHFRELQRRLGRGNEAAVPAFLIAPGWTGLLEDGLDLTKLAKEQALATKGDDGCLLAIPSPIRAAAQAAAFLSAGGFRWVLTAQGMGGEEEIWLVGVLGRTAIVSSELTTAILDPVQKDIVGMMKCLQENCGRSPVTIDLSIETL